MVRKSKEADRAYMRTYMRKRRAKEKARREEAELEQSKLKTINSILSYTLVHHNHSKEELEEKPQFTISPIQEVKTVATGRIIHKPHVFNENGSLVQAPPVTKKVKFTEKRGVAGHVKHPPSPPPATWVPYIKQINRHCLSHGKNVTEYHIFKEIKHYMTAYSVSDLNALDWQFQWLRMTDKAQAIPATREQRRTKRAVLQDVVRLGKERMAAHDKFESFAINCILQGLSDEQIIRESKKDEKASKFFNYEIEDLAPVVIEKLRKYLGIPGKTKPLAAEKPLSPTFAEDSEEALDVLEKAAKLRQFKAAKALVDGKRTAERQGQPIEAKKKKRYHVTVEE